MHALLLSLALAVPVERAETQVALLGSDDFREREAAARSLRDLGWWAVPVLRRHVGHPDPEVAARCRALVEGRRARQRRAAEELAAASFDDYPMIDALYYDIRSQLYFSDCPLAQLLIPRYLDRCVAVPEDFRGQWTRYRQAAKLMTEDLLDLGVPLWAVKALHFEMYRRDMHFFVDRGGHNPTRWIKPAWFWLPTPLPRYVATEETDGPAIPYPPPP